MIPRLVVFFIFSIVLALALLPNRVTVSIWEKFDYEQYLVSYGVLVFYTKSIYFIFSYLEQSFTKKIACSVYCVLLSELCFYLFLIGNVVINFSLTSNPTFDLFFIVGVILKEMVLVLSFYFYSNRNIPNLSF